MSRAYTIYISRLRFSDDRVPLQYGSAATRDVRGFPRNLAYLQVCRQPALHLRALLVLANKKVSYAIISRFNESSSLIYYLMLQISIKPVHPNFDPIADCRP